MVPKVFALIPIFGCAVVIGVAGGMYLTSLQVPKEEYIATTNIIEPQKVLGVETDFNNLVISEVFVSQDAFSQWVEIYNPNEKPVNISNWSIRDDKSCDEFLGGSKLPAGGYAIISPSPSTTFNSSLFIPLSTKIGNGIEDGDTLYLSSTGCENEVKIVDQVIITSTKEGQSLQKSELGFTASDNPTPGQN